MTLRVPSEGVVLVRAGDNLPTVEKPAHKTGVDQVVFQSDFFTRKRDYLNTIDKMAAVLKDDLRSPEVADKKQPTKDAFDLKVSELEERCEKNFNGIGSEIKADCLLLDIEKEEVEKALIQQKRQVIDQLKEAVKRRGANEFRRNLRDWHFIVIRHGGRFR